MRKHTLFCIQFKPATPLDEYRSKAKMQSVRIFGVDFGRAAHSRAVEKQNAKMSFSAPNNPSLSVSHAAAAAAGWRYGRVFAHVVSCATSNGSSFSHRRASFYSRYKSMRLTAKRINLQPATTPSSR